MNCKFVHLLLLLLAVALPVRGFADALPLCDEARPVAAMADGMNDAARGEMNPAAMPAGLAMDHDTGPSHPHGGPGGAACGAFCAACAGAALRSAAPGFCVLANHPSVIPFSGLPFAGFIGEPAQRPPSSRIA